VGGAAWGAIGQLREGLDFRPDEAAFLHTASVPLGESIRRALLAQAMAADDAATGPGVVLLDDEQRLEAMTPPAERLLRELVDVPAGGFGSALPYVVHAVATRAQLTERAGPPAQARVRTRAGRWLLLHGSLLQGARGPRTAVIVEEASAAGVAPILEQAYGFTARESDVARLLLRGLSTKDIAAELFISPYTVQEHCVAIFEKVGVHSRRELVGRVFYQQYEPRRLAGPGPSALGWFQQPAGTRGVDGETRA
jgi:DNA-binding CsgD family transcriptional regulator